MHRYVEREHRVAVRCPCTIIEPDGFEIESELTNLSRGGFGLRAAAELVAGEIVQLRTHRSVPQRARLQWTRGDDAGGMFLDGAPPTA